MKINEVEALAGITKKNIRFYEEQGLLNPRRNEANGYREYGEEEVRILKRIKLLRKLGVPIEEIRRIFSEEHTVGDGMRRHLVTLEREQRNLEQSIALCCDLQCKDVPVSEFDAEEILEQMEFMERSGTSFQNKHTQDVRTHFVAPIIITVLVVGMMLSLAMLVIWAYAIAPEEAPPVVILWLTVFVCAAIGSGVVLALIQRLKEIGKGEVEDAKKY